MAEKFIEYTVTNEKVDEAPEEGLYLENLNDGTSDYVDSEFTESEAQIKIGVVEIVKLFLIGLSLIGISISFSTLYILRMRPRVNIIEDVLGGNEMETLQLKNISYFYNKEIPILQNISIRFEREKNVCHSRKVR